MSERQALESLQRRASLNNPGDREPLIANTDTLEFPPDQIAAGGSSSRRATDLDGHLATCPVYTTTPARPKDLAVRPAIELADQ